MKSKLIRFSTFFSLDSLDDDLMFTSESSNANRVLFEEEIPTENQNVTSSPFLTNYVPSSSSTRDENERLDAKILPGVKMHAYGNKKIVRNLTFFFVKTITF